MKRTKIIILSTVAVIGLSLTSCEQESVSESEVKSETLKQFAKIIPDDVLFDDVFEFLDYYDALCPNGEAYILIPYSNGIAISETLAYKE